MSFWEIGLAIFLILYGLLAISNFSFVGATVALGILAMGTGVLMFVRK